MSHTHLAHQYFTSKPNLLRMTTYHRQDMSFTAATFTFSVFPICTHPHRHTDVRMHMCTQTHINCCAYFFMLYFIRWHMWWCCPSYKHPYLTLEISKTMHCTWISFVCSKCKCKLQELKWCWHKIFPTKQSSNYSTRGIMGQCSIWSIQLFHLSIVFQNE